MGDLNKMRILFGIISFTILCISIVSVFTVKLPLDSLPQMLHRNGWFNKQDNQLHIVDLQMSHPTDTDFKEVKSSFRPVDDKFYFDYGTWIKKPVHESGRGKFKHFYLFGAAICNSSESSIWDELRIYGQWLKTYVQESKILVNCCIKYMDGYISTVNARVVTQTNQAAIIPEFYFTFTIPRQNATNLPTEVSLVTGNTTCSDADIPYIKPFYPLKETGKLGVSSKFAHDNLSSEAIIEWVETMKHLAVDKIIMYADESLNDVALKTMQYYERTGLVEVFPYKHQAAKDHVLRNQHEKTFQKYADEKVVVYDSFARLRGYTYFGIIDVDEYLIPSKGRSLKQLMGNLLAQAPKRKKKAMGFYFKTVFFVKSWGMVNSSSDLDIGKYLNTTDWGPIFNCRKAIAVNDNVLIYKGIHEVTPKSGYTMINCPANEAYIRHYRNCRYEWMGKKECMKEFKRVTTNEMIQWAIENVADRIRQVRKDLFG